MTGGLDRGRKAFDAQAWAEAYAQLSAADHASRLGPEDLERLATTAYLTGKDDESDDLWARAHREWLHLDDTARAARCGFWLAFLLLLRGEEAQSGGWLARSRSLIRSPGDARSRAAGQGPRPGLCLVSVRRLDSEDARPARNRPPCAAGSAPIHRASWIATSMIMSSWPLT
jgi:hypothetical protein